MNSTFETQIVNNQLYVLVPEFLISQDQELVHDYLHSLVSFISTKLTFNQSFQCSQFFKNYDRQQVLNYYRQMGFDVNYKTNAVISSTPLLLFMRIKKKSFLTPLTIDLASFDPRIKLNNLQELICTFSLSLVNLFDNHTLEAIVNHDITFDSLFNSNVFSHCFEIVANRQLMAV
jgi:hypothetical protein